MLNRFYITYLLVLFWGFSSHAQTYKHTTLWSRLAVQKTIKKLDLRVEFDFRQQNDFQKSSINPLSKPNLRWIRLNTTYNTGKFAHSIIWPNLIKSFPLIGSKTDLTRPEQREWRTTFNEEFTQSYKKLRIGLRLGYEIRNITANQNTRNANRVRLRLSETLKINKKSTVNSSFEYLWNVMPSEATNPFNQSQLAFRYIHNFGGNLSFTTGINHIFRQRVNQDIYDSENAILCNILINI